MDLNDILFGPEHDAVIRASASTYSPNELATRGLKIDLNVSSNENKRFVGNVANKTYPDLVVWRPDYLNANTGQAVVVEAIETAHTLSPLPINKWRNLASSGAKFNLIIPAAYLLAVRDALRVNNITSGFVLQTYFVDGQNRYTFTTVT